MEQPHAYRNGHHATPPADGGVVLVERPARTERTVFLDDARLRGGAALFYALHRFFAFGLPASRVLTLLWLLAALVWATGALPGRWWGVAAALTLLLAQIAWGVLVRRRNYVRFTPAPFPPLAAQPLTPPEKLPVYVTGLLTVEGKYQHFTWQPGFYRTFATGEHALLCLVRPRTWLRFATWLPEETGMWYAFIAPDALQELRWGSLTFGANRGDTLAVTYRLEIPPNGRHTQPIIRNETLYITVTDPHHGARIIVDLLHHLPDGHPLNVTGPAQHPSQTAP